MGFGGRDRYTPEQCLADILSVRIDSALERSSPHLWESVVELSQRHRVHLLLRKACLERRGSIPPGPLQILEYERGAWLAKRQALRSALRDVAEIARGSHIDVIILKGPNLAERLYPDPLSRPFRDLDLLVRAEQLVGFLTAFRGSGYQMAPGPYAGLALSNLMDWRLPVTISPPGMMGISIDLHSSPVSRLEAFHFPSERLWDRAEPWEDGLKQLSDPDFLLLLFIHAMKHGYLDLLGFLDLEMASRSASLPDCLGEVCRVAEENCFSTCIAAAMRIGQRLLGTEWVRTVPRSGKYRARLVESLTRRSAQSARPLISERVQLLIVHPLLLDGWTRRARFLGRLLIRPPGTIGQIPFKTGLFTNPWASLVRICRRLTGKGSGFR